MSISPISQNIALQKSTLLTQNITPNAGDVAAFEANLEAPFEASAENHQNSFENSNSTSTPDATMDAVWKNFNNSIFDHDRRDLTRWDQMRKEIDYGNKT